MEKYIVMLSFVWLFYACNGQGNLNQTKEIATEGTHISLLPVDTTLLPEDPYFVVTNDTFSSTGPRSITRNVLEDRSGNIWLASWEGIIKYDGKTFTNYTLKEDLRRFHVFSLMEDREGYIWFGTIRGGLYRYDPKADHSSMQYDPKKSGIKPFTLFTTKDGLANDMVLCMMQDKSGVIWIGTDEGVSRYDPGVNHEEGNSVFTNITTSDGLCGNSVNSISQDARGRIWFGTRGGAEGDVCYYDGTSFTLFSRISGSPFSNVRMIIEDKKGMILIGGQDGLYRYDPDAASMRRDAYLTLISNGFIGYIFEDEAGKLWLSKGDGQGMSLYTYDGTNTVRIASRVQVFGITEDRHGNIWFGSLEGLERYDGSTVEGFVD